MKTLEEAIEKVDKIVSKLARKNSRESRFGNKLLGFVDDVYRVYGKPNKNPIFLLANEQMAFIELVGYFPLTTALSRMSKRQHKILQEGIDIITEAYEKSKSQKNLEDFTLKEKPNKDNGMKKQQNASLTPQKSLTNIREKA